MKKNDLVFFYKTNHAVMPSGRLQEHEDFGELRNIKALLFLLFKERMRKALYMFRAMPCLQDEEFQCVLDGYEVDFDFWVALLFAHHPDATALTILPKDMRDAVSAEINAF